MLTPVVSETCRAVVSYDGGSPFGAFSVRSHCSFSASVRRLRSRGVRAAWYDFAAHTDPPNEHQAPRDGTPQGDFFLERGLETVKRRYHEAADHIGGLAQHPSWQLVTSVLDPAREAMDTLQLGAHRFSADHATLGTGRVLWVRTMELISHGVRGLLGRLDRGGERDGLR